VFLKKFRGKIKTDFDVEPMPAWTICVVKLLFIALNIQLLGGTEFKRGLVLLRCIILSHKHAKTIKPDLFHLLASLLVLEWESHAIFQVMDVLTAVLV
jgi:hypothetical protein